MMKSLLLVLAMAASLLGQSTDDKSIRDLIQSYMDTRGRLDAKAVEGLFTADVDQLVSSGEWRKGKAAVVAGTIGSSQQSTETRTLTVDTIRMVTGDIAVVDCRYVLGARNMWSTFVVKREAGRWLISAIRNMLPATAGR
jgi:uncharacterized protein (TIGR02246 family)